MVERSMGSYGRAERGARVLDAVADVDSEVDEVADDVADELDVVCGPEACCVVVHPVVAMAVARTTVNTGTARLVSLRPRTHCFVTLTIASSSVSGTIWSNPQRVNR
jgi:hypothetical protein